MIPETFLSASIQTADIVANNSVHHIDFGTLYDDETVVTGSKRKINRLNKVNASIFYDNYLQAQMDGRASVSISNLTSLLHNFKFFSVKFKSNVRMYGATSKQIITPRVVRYMRVRVLTRQRLIDVKYYYLPYFSTTLLQQVSVIKATGQLKHYIPSGMQLFFIPNEVVIDRDLMSKSINLQNVDYNHNDGTCMLTCVHCHKHSCIIFVPGVI